MPIIPPSLAFIDRDLIQIAEHLTEKQITEVEAAMKALNDLGNDLQLWMIHEYNFDELHTFFIQLSKDYAERVKSEGPANIGYEFMRQNYIHLNRLVANFLASTRMFLDIYARQMSPDKKLFDSFKQMTSYEYDNNFSYRFLYRLRNFCQHKILPISRFKVSIEKPNDHKLEYLNEIEILVSRDELLAGDGWSTVRGELVNQEEQIDLVQHVYQYHTGLLSIQRRLAFHKIQEYDALFSPLITLLKQHDSFPGLPYIMQSTAGNVPYSINQREIPTFLLDYAAAIKANFS